MMSAFRRLFCVVRLGHRWETAEDPYGGVTVCSRCGYLRHVPSGMKSPWTLEGSLEFEMDNDRRETAAAREKES